MSEEKKNMIKQTVENLKHLDEESLKIMKSNSEILKARDALEKKKGKEWLHEEYIMHLDGTSINKKRAPIYQWQIGAQFWN